MSAFQNDPSRGSSAAVACSLVDSFTTTLAIPALAGASVTPIQFGAGCEVIGQVDLKVSVVTSSDNTPADAAPVQVGGHEIWEDRTNGARQCGFTSFQGRAHDGRYDGWFAEAEPPGGEALPAGACDQVERALMAFVDTAGLN